MRFAASVLVAFTLLAGAAQADEVKIKGFNFGQIELGQTVSGDITARAKQPSGFNGSTFSALNPNSGVFDFSSVRGCVDVIPVEGCTNTITFRPADPGRFEATYCFGLFDPSLDPCAIIRGQVG
jgi:hypothetical protein